MKQKLVLIALATAICCSSCMTVTHTVGEGAKTNVTVKKKAVYALWGAVPVSDPDSKQMANGAKDYTVVTRITFGDAIVNCLLSVITLRMQTVKVTK